jgi:hypothetical protein
MSEGAQLTSGKWVIYDYPKEKEQLVRWGDNN